VESALGKNMCLSAAFMAERLTMMKDSNIADYILYAKCYFRDGQPRRCLAILEQKGLLSANVVRMMGVWMRGGEAVSATATYLSQIAALALAAQCLVSIEQHEDCVSLLEPVLVLMDLDSAEAVERMRGLTASQPGQDVIVLSGIYSLVGRCYDILDHRSVALKALTVALKLDLHCVEAVEYIVDNGLLTDAGKIQLYRELDALNTDHWLLPSYRVLLLGHDPVAMEPTNSVSTEDMYESGLSASALARRAVYCFERQDVGEAYRLARQAYALDPYDERGLVVYIASMVELRLKSELFYLGHELVNSLPKMAMSWYCVGCYYWCCSKRDLAQKHLLKATKLDKRFFRAWVLLGHVLSAQEESEQAISAYRTAARLLPGDHRPMVFMAQELQRTNVLAPALHILTGALECSPMDAGLLNELAVIYVKQEKFDLALPLFQRAVQALDGSYLAPGEDVATTHAWPKLTFNRSGGLEIFTNYATALRKCARYEDALFWYDKCLAASPNDANCYASVGFTFHLMQRFDMAVSSYHQALAIQPNFTFCSDMLSRAMDDMSYYDVSPAGAGVYSNFTRLSNYCLGDEPDASAESGWLDGSADDGAPQASFAEGSFLSLSAVDSFTRVEGRLSLGSQWKEGNVTGVAGDDSYISQQSVEDNGGFLDDSF